MRTVRPKNPDHYFWNRYADPCVTPSEITPYEKKQTEIRPIPGIERYAEQKSPTVQKTLRRVRLKDFLYEAGYSTFDHMVKRGTLVVVFKGGEPFCVY